MRLRIRRHELTRIRMRLFPKLTCDWKRLDPEVLPPAHLIACLMQIAVMRAAERDSELIAHLHADCTGLCEAKVMRIGWLTAADEAGLRRDVFEMVLVPKALWLWKGEGAFVDASRGPCMDMVSLLNPSSIAGS